MAKLKRKIYIEFGERNIREKMYKDISKLLEEDGFKCTFHKGGYIMAPCLIVQSEGIRGKIRFKESNKTTIHGKTKIKKDDSPHQEKASIIINILNSYTPDYLKLKHLKNNT